MLRPTRSGSDVRGGPRVIVASGHMVDAPDRPNPRFPAYEVPRVAAEVRDVLKGWRVGDGTTLITGGARGGDIIAAEAARARGAALRLVLALPPDQFEHTSVAIPNSDWSSRFRALLEVSDVEIVSQTDGDVFARTNEAIIAHARRIDPELHALVVWDGERGDGAGGTSDFVKRLGLEEDDPRLQVIDPRPHGRR